MSSAARNPDIDAALLSELLEYIGSYQTTYGPDAIAIKSYAAAYSLLANDLATELDNAREQLIVDSIPEYNNTNIRPIVLQRSTRNTSTDTMLKLDGSVVLDSPEHLYTLGEQFLPEGSHSYPAGISDEVTGIGRIQNAVVRSTTVLREDVDYHIVGSTLVFESDPFDNKDFTLYDVDGEQFIVVWAAEVRGVSNYGASHFGVLLGIPGKDGEAYNKILRSAWDIAFNGLTPQFMARFIAAVTGLPVIEVESVVISVTPEAVVCDTGTYLTPTAIPDTITPGAVLEPGTILSSSVRIFGGSNSTVANDRDLLNDLGVLHLTKGVSADGALSLGVEDDYILYAGLDGNGNPLVRFPLGPDDDDLWASIWQRTEDAGIDMTTYFTVSGITPSTPIGTIVGQTSPARWVLDNFIGNNLIFVWLDVPTLPDTTQLIHLNMIERYAPAHVHTIIAMTATPEDESEYDLGESTDVPAAAYAAMAVDILGDASTLNSPNYTDYITTIWIPSPC